MGRSGLKTRHICRSVSPVELLLSGCVAVGGVPAVEVALGFPSQPLDRLLVESGDSG
jgi:hypothetical protein